MLQKCEMLFLYILLSGTCFLGAKSMFRGYRETCGTHLHAQSRDTVAEGRQCDTSKGLVCSSGACDCSNNIHGDVEHVFWNNTHCVVKLNETCRVVVPELSFLPNANKKEDLLCGRDAVCTDMGCECPEGFEADIGHLNCIPGSSASSTFNTAFTVKGTIFLFSGTVFLMSAA